MRTKLHTGLAPRRMLRGFGSAVRATVLLGMIAAVSLAGLPAAEAASERTTAASTPAVARMLREPATGLEATAIEPQVAPTPPPTPPAQTPEPVTQAPEGTPATTPAATPTRPAPPPPTATPTPTNTPALTPVPEVGTPIPLIGAAPTARPQGTPPSSPVIRRAFEFQLDVEPWLSAFLYGVGISTAAVVFYLIIVAIRR